MTHFEDVGPDVRPAPIAGSWRGGAIGLYADGDPEAAPLLSVSEASAYDLAVDLLVASTGVAEGDVRDALRRELEA